MRPQRLAPEYTDAELDALHAARHPDSGEAFTLVLALVGMGLSLWVALTLEKLGIVRTQDGLVVVALMALFWLGFGAAVLGRAWNRRQARTLRIPVLRAALSGIVLRIGPAGVTMRHAGLRVALRWTEPFLWTEDRAGMLLLRHAGQDLVIGLPHRLLAEGQADAIMKSISLWADDDNWSDAEAP